MGASIGLPDCNGVDLIAVVGLNAALRLGAELREGAIVMVSIWCVGRYHYDGIAIF